MAYIQGLVDKEGNSIYPPTVASAVYVDEERNHNEPAEAVRQAERYRQHCERYENVFSGWC